MAKRNSSRENVWKINFSHGMSKTKAYVAWVSMLTRCENKKATRYPYYGGRGVFVCKRWHKFENFYADMGDPPTSGHSLDRINPNGHYFPENCRWADKQTQSENRRTARIIEIDGQRKTLTAWTRIFGIGRTTVDKRLLRGIPASEAFLPVRGK